MGRFLACGVLTRIKIIKGGSNPDYKISKEKENIIKQLNKYVDISNYEIEEYENGFELDLKKEIFNENIYALFEELDTVIDCTKKYLYDTRESELCLELKKYDDNYKYESDYEKEHNYGDFQVKTKDDQYRLDQVYYPSVDWLLYGNRTMIRNLIVRIDIVNLWRDEDKILTEDDYSLLHIMNTIKTKYFNTPLSKNLIIYISG